MASSLDEVCVEDGNSLFTDSGHQAWTSLFSLENKNLFPAGPQNTAAFSPRRCVLNTVDEYLAIRSNTNFSGCPFHPAERNSRLSPINGHPVFPGGRVPFPPGLLL
nr:hypothetical protein MIMGU_mgv1a014435mg [Ipomoea trifida]GME20676.1 hypothetical protein MIMGU_mgv1a014435mg [Ipomoea batatas]